MSAFASLGDFQRAHILESWQLGLTKSEACRAWLRAPDSGLLDDDRVQRGYRAGVDHEGQSLSENARGLVHFIGRANLGRVAVAQYPDAAYLVIRHPRYKTWIALIEEWGLGITVYSRWSAVATINLDHAPSEQDFARIIRYAQRLSSQRPKLPRDGPDYVDPQRPTIMMSDGEEHVLHPPDIIDRIVAKLRRLF